jgi:ribosomal protein S18 acetylase RimI-like enzyme
MIVAQQCRGKKYGSKLFDYAMQAIVEKVHPSQLILYTSPDNSAAISIYIRAGFVIREWISDKYGPGKHRLKLTKNITVNP